LCAPSELSGALNKALDGLERVRRRCWFTEPLESRNKLKCYQAANDALAAWLDQHTIISQDAEVPQSELHAAYTLDCQQSCRRAPSKQLFGRRLQTLRPQIEMAQRSVAGRRVWVYGGIDFRNRGVNETPGD
jgi:putative DNA primase/helicase